jgi:hypothetical protein
VVSGMHGVSSGEVLLDGPVCQGWWLVEEHEFSGRIVAGPFSDRAEAGWATDAHGYGRVQPVYGLRRADGGLTRKPSPQDWAWLAHLGQQLDRLPEDWDADLAEDDPLVTLVVEVTAVLAEAGLPLHDSRTADSVFGGACLTPEPSLGGLVISWRQHDRMSVDRVHGATADGLMQEIMNRTLAEVLQVRGFVVDAFGDAGGYVVRSLL